MNYFTVALIFFLLIPQLKAQSKEETQPQDSPFWRGLPFGSQALNPDISLIGDFLFRPGAREPGQKAFSLREAELGIQAVVDPYARADIFTAFEEEEGKFEADVEEAFMTLLSLPLKTQLKFGRFQVDFGRTHRTHAPERDFVDTPLAIERILGAEKAMKANGISGNILLPVPWSAYHELRTEIGETKVQFGEESEAIQSEERFAYGRMKNFFSLNDTTNLELSGGFGRWQIESGIEKQNSTATFEGRAPDLVRSLSTADFALKWKPDIYKSALLECAWFYSESRPLTELVAEDGTRSLVHENDAVHIRGGFVHLQIQPLRRWYLGSRIDHVLHGENHREERLYAGILTFFPSEFSRVRLQWNRKDSDREEREHRFFLQVTWSLGPHRPHPF